jgi:hypothetical protein
MRYKMLDKGNGPEQQKRIYAVLEKFRSLTETKVTVPKNPQKKEFVVMSSLHTERVESTHDFMFLLHPARLTLDRGLTCTIC